MKVDLCPNSCRNTHELNSTIQVSNEMKVSWPRLRLKIYIQYDGETGKERNYLSSLSPFVPSATCFLTRSTFCSDDNLD